MTHLRHALTHIPRPLVRALAALGAVVAFLSISSIISPTSSIGGGFDEETTLVDRPPAASPEREPALPLVTLHGREYEITVHAGGYAPLYTVRDAAGRTLIERATAEEVDRRLPDLGVLDLIASPAVGEVDVPMDPGF